MPITACVAVEAVATAKAMGNGKFRSLLHISKKAQPISMNLKTAPEDHHLTLMSKFGENHRGNFFYYSMKVLRGSMTFTPLRTLKVSRPEIS